MAKGTAAKSASGASMSKYDVEVEKRLQALESKGGTSGDLYFLMVNFIYNIEVK